MLPGTQLAIHKQAFHNIAKCIGVISLSVQSKTVSVVEKFIEDVKNETCTTSVKLLALFSIGEIGRHRYSIGNKIMYLFIY